MFQQVPPPCLIVRAQEQDGLGTGATPEYARPFQTQVDDAAHGTFDGTTPDRQLHGHQLRIGHATLMLYKVVIMRADRPAVTPSARSPALPCSTPPCNSKWRCWVRHRVRAFVLQSLRRVATCPRRCTAW